MAWDPMLKKEGRFSRLKEAVEKQKNRMAESRARKREENEEYGRIRESSYAENKRHMMIEKARREGREKANREVNRPSFGERVASGARTAAKHADEYYGHKRERPRPRKHRHHTHHRRRPSRRPQGRSLFDMI
jgi:hypothetical protein